MRAGPAAVLAVLSLAASLLGYGFTLVMSRALPVAGFGELSSLVGVLVVATVAGTALQAVLARRIAGGERPDPARLLGDTAVVAGGVGVAVAALTPVLVALLDLPAAAVLALAVAMVPTTWCFGVQGLLQGGDRLVCLGLVLALVQLAKFAAGLVTAAAGGSVVTAFVLVAVLTAVVAAAVTPLAVRAGPGRPTWDRAGAGAWARDVAAVLGVLVLTSLDLLLARHHLDPTTSGLYAAGNVVARGAFWAPAFVALAAYPRLSDPGTRPAALRRAAATVAGVDAVAVLGAWALQALVPALLGAAYRPVASLAWVFALEGTALAGLQLAVYAGLAVHDRRAAVGVWVVGAADVGLVAVWHDGLRQVLAVCTACPVVVLVAVVLVVRRPPRAGRAARAARASQWAAASQVRPTPTDTSSGTAPSA